MQPELYINLARFYDKIYHWKDYDKEVRILAKIIQKYKKSSGGLLLDVGCGTGEHIKHFSKMGFECVGLDSSKYMISVARAKLADTKFIIGSMTDFSLDSRYDIVTCLFGAFGYLKTHLQIEKAVHNFSRHLKTGGILIIEPWLTKKQFKTAIHLQIYEDSSLKIARVNSTSTKGNFTVIDDRYLIAEKEKGVSYLKDYNELRFFDPKELKGILEKAELEPIGIKQRLEPDRELVISIKTD
ncbi:MAG: class I SAM-dependent DNA methyltransferase [Nitrososphaerales archaeon]